MMMKISIIMGIKGWAKCILDTLSKLPNILFPNQIQNCLLVSRENWRWRDGTALLLRDQYTQHNNIPATATHHSKQPQVLQIQMDFGVFNCDMTHMTR